MNDNAKPSETLYVFSPAGWKTVNLEEASIHDESEFISHETANAIIQIRTKLELTQLSFAKRMGVTKQTVNAWESGLTITSQRVLEKARTVLDDEDFQLLSDAIRTDKMNRRIAKEITSYS